MNFLKSLILSIILIHSFSMDSSAQSKKEPLKIGVAGLTHTHVHWLLGRPAQDDIQIVGISEANTDLAKRYTEQHGLSMDMVYDSLEEMIEKTKPDAVTAFGSIYDHLKVVEICAPKGIHVMVEKPLAVSMEHAIKMKALAEKHNIHLLTNYETTWYASNHKAKDMLDEGTLGPLRKLVIHDGHRGPKEIGVNDEFLEWLTDPIQNGGGALTDFGCYGANLAVWLLNGDRPESVTGITQTIKPDVYPNVDDEATVILKYKDAQIIIQASWNWPVSRKDMEVYGKKGFAVADNGSQLRYRLGDDEDEVTLSLESRPYPLNDPFALLAAVVNGEIKLPEYDLSSLENNMLVVEILEAAKLSAISGKTVPLKTKKKKKKK